MGLPKKLTEQQMRFAQELVTNEGRKTATQCAIDAGYSKESARQYASKLQNPQQYPLVVQHIGELRTEYQKKYDVTFERHIAELGKIRQEALKKGAWSAAVNAEVARGKAGGLYVDQKLVVTGNLDKMSEEELQAKMQQILDDHKNLINITPEKEQLKSVEELNPDNDSVQQ